MWDKVPPDVQQQVVKAIALDRAYRNAAENSDAQNAAIELDAAIQRALTDSGTALLRESPEVASALLGSARQVKDDAGLREQVTARVESMAGNPSTGYKLPEMSVDALRLGLATLEKTERDYEPTSLAARALRDGALAYREELARRESAATANDDWERKKKEEIINALHRARQDADTAAQQSDDARERIKRTMEDLIERHQRTGGGNAPVVAVYQDFIQAVDAHNDQRVLSELQGRIKELQPSLNPYTMMWIRRYVDEHSEPLPMADDEPAEPSKADLDFDRAKAHVAELEQAGNLPGLAAKYMAWDEVDVEGLSPERMQEHAELGERLRGYADQQSEQWAQSRQREEERLANSPAGRARARLTEADKLATARLPQQADESVIRERAIAYLRTYEDVMGGQFRINFEAAQEVPVDALLNMMSHVASQTLSKDSTRNLRRALDRARKRTDQQFAGNVASLLTTAEDARSSIVQLRSEHDLDSVRDPDVTLQSVRDAVAKAQEEYESGDVDKANATLQWVREAPLEILTQELKRTRQSAATVKAQATRERRKAAEDAEARRHSDRVDELVAQGMNPADAILAANDAIAEPPAVAETLTGVSSEEPPPVVQLWTGRALTQGAVPVVLTERAAEPGDEVTFVLSGQDLYQDLGEVYTSVVPLDEVNRQQGNPPASARDADLLLLDKADVLVVPGKVVADDPVRFDVRDRTYWGEVRGGPGERRTFKVEKPRRSSRAKAGRIASAR